MWKTLCSFSAEMRRFSYILSSKTAQIHCGASGLVFLSRPEVRGWGGHVRCSKALAKLRWIVLFQVIPGDEFCQLDPEIITTEFDDKGQEEVF